MEDEVRGREGGEEKEEGRKEGPGPGREGICWIHEQFHPVAISREPAAGKRKCAVQCSV